MIIPTQLALLHTSSHCEADGVRRGDAQLVHLG
jgi:hypothetical protein